MDDDTAEAGGLCLCQQDAYLRSLTTTVTRCIPVELPPTPPAAAAKGPGKDKDKGRPGKSANGGGPAAAGSATATAPESAAVSSSVAARYEVYLADTPMFPESGGQPCDQGQILVQPVPSANGGEAQPAVAAVAVAVNVLAVIWKEGALCHLTDAPLDPGTTVEVRLDWQRRYDHMQQHTGQHVFSAVADLLLGADTASWELHPLDAATHGSGDYGCVAVDLTASQISTEQLLELEARANAELRGLRAVTPLVLDPRVTADVERMEALRSDPAFRGQLPSPDKIKGGKLRLIHVEGLDINACGGTHVRSTGEVQVVKVVGAERARGHTRVRLMAGDRALAALGGCLGREAALTAKLTCPPSKHAEMVGMLLRDRREGAKARKLLAAELAALQGRDLALALGGTASAASAPPHPGGQSWALLHRPASDLDFLSLVAAAALEAAPGLQLLMLTTDNTEPGAAAPSSKAGGEDGVEVTFLVAGRPELVRSVGARVAEALGGRGGGRPGRFQGKATGLFRLPAAVQAFREAVSAAELV
ncbi:Alanyl-tRNA editing protein Aarsd1 [Pleodorina starrii]|uniref:Alanyl-tRNA editing protein Aarsd1 n=1 Tax=Pleodorina starrii TaxID=330485 RepID=A0A9W6BJZ3_9CHLO|nr:Alanyl-tRNA editing protein Aarsd1 [Pleodorina starrii]GLC53243.1 Alanyl-tRNA editing protein Aarsd1 [Pleodorina starrii]GLC68123.1 Alanyl-tRNA editing protein Aarsd1 [Pleodorina starrii]